MMVLTVAIAMGAKKEAKAMDFSFFDKSRISVDKCAITLLEDDIPWTGDEIEPKVRVNYKGTDLQEGVDYILTYRNNVDAGDAASVKITGKGDYKGKETVRFTIKGIDIKEDCIVSINQNEVKVYYNGRLLIEDKEYWVNDALKQEVLKESIKVGNKKLNTYEVTQYICVSGKGQFTGTVTEVFKTVTQRYE